MSTPYEDSKLSATLAGEMINVSVKILGAKEDILFEVSLSTLQQLSDLASEEETLEQIQCVYKSLNCKDDGTDEEVE